MKEERERGGCGLDNHPSTYGYLGGCIRFDDIVAASEKGEKEVETDPDPFRDLDCSTMRKLKRKRGNRIAGSDSIYNRNPVVVVVARVEAKDLVVFETTSRFSLRSLTRDRSSPC